MQQRRNYTLVFYTLVILDLSNHISRTGWYERSGLQVSSPDFCLLCDVKSKVGFLSLELSSYGISNAAKATFDSTLTKFRWFLRLQYAPGGGKRCFPVSFERLLARG